MSKQSYHYKLTRLNSILNSIISFKINREVWGFGAPELRLVSPSESGCAGLWTNERGVLWDDRNREAGAL